MVSPFFSLENRSLENQAGIFLLRLQSQDGTNRLTQQSVQALQEIVGKISAKATGLVIAGNTSFFSVGAELEEITSLDAPNAYEFSKMGQALMSMIDQFPAPVFAAIEGYCMGGGLDLVLACHHRIASSRAIFGHRGAALGLITGWGAPSGCLDWWAKAALWKCSSRLRRSRLRRRCRWARWMRLRRIRWPKRCDAPSRLKTELCLARTPNRTAENRRSGPRCIARLSLRGIP